MVTIRKPKNALKFSKPAGWWGSTWREGIPTGNGVIGASVLGGACEDTVIINHSDSWWQGYVGVLQDVADKLPNVRKQMDEGRPRDAEQILSNGLIQKGFRPQAAYPLPICDFKISMRSDKPAREYQRVLNMENGEVSVSFKDGTTRFDRSMFVSRANGVIAYEITKAGPKGIEVTFSFDQRDKFNIRTPQAVSKTPDGVMTKYENYFMYFSARSDNSTEFGCAAFINYYGGSQVVTSNGITVKGADRVLVLLKPFVETQREKAWKELNAELKAIKLPYDKLLKEHTPLHGKLLGSADFDLFADDRDEFADKLLDHAFETGEISPALLEKLWAYGRYLMICGSSPGSRPLPPLGLWCGDYKAQGSQITADGSLQTIYNHCLAGNLPDFLLSVFTYYESVLTDLKKNSSRLYGCKGIFIPSLSAHGTGILGSVEPSVIHFTGVAGWVSQLFYNYYRYTDDIKFLKERALPFMKEAALFYENYFKVQGDSSYETCPSYSPGTTPANYNQNGETMDIAKNALIDFAIAKELFKNLIEGSEIAGMNKSELPKWRDMLTRIPAYQISADNTVREYCDARYQDNPAAVSPAMFYPVYPGSEIGGDNPEIRKAFENTAKKKLASANVHFTSQALTRYANIFARLGDGDAALEAITSAVRAMAMNNLIFAETDWRGMGLGKVDNWAAYTVEPNMAVTGAVQEMLVRSSDGITVELLPALPNAFTKGSIGGFLTRAGVEVTEMSWDIKKGSLTAKLKSRKNGKVNIQLPKGAKGPNLKQIGSAKFDPETGLITGLELPSGKAISLDIKL